MITKEKLEARASQIKQDLEKVVSNHHALMGALSIINELMGDFLEEAKAVNEKGESVEVSAE